MAPPLQGLTLGQRQKFYNELVDIAMKEELTSIPNINFEEDDIDNMIRIDIACKQKNVVYILDVLKCEDMMYVSRAINKSTWLITDPQYAHIINPKYLHSELFPQMNAKAVTKLMLHIRRHLRDEVRVKAFYKYVCEKNPMAALRWLVNCPLKFIEKIIAARADDIPSKLLKRLFKKSLNLLHVFLKNRTYSAVSGHYVTNETKYLLKKKTTAEGFLDVILAHHNCFCCNINLNRKYTNIVMKSCSNKTKENFLKLYNKIDLSVFVKCIKGDDLKPFLMNISSSNSWKCFETLTPFLNKLPRDEVLDFLRALYNYNNVDTESSNSSTSCSSSARSSSSSPSRSRLSSDTSENDRSDVEALFYAIESGNYDYKNFSNVYRWYRFAPFDIAFRDLKKFIFAESTPEERHSMLIVLLNCASYDDNHFETVLQYYHDKHINEPYLHKKNFINSVLTQFYAFRFNDSNWNILNALFHSSEVYIESTNDVKEVLIAIIVRSVLSNKPVHEVVEEKFEIETLQDIRRELSPDEQDKVFNYLHSLLIKRLNLQNSSSETGMQKAIKLLKTMWSLINDWDRLETHHRFVIEKICEFCEILMTSSWIQEMQITRRKRRKKIVSNRHWNARRRFRLTPKYNIIIDLSSLYKMTKSYRKYLFEKSLILHTSEEVLINSLKHDPGLLVRYKSEIDSLRKNDEISLNKFLSKLRIYWLDTLAQEWIQTNKAHLLKLSGHRALVRGILMLMPRNKALDFITTYTPVEKKIQWAETDEIELSIQKHIAKNMHIARPQLPSEVVLWYAKGDYLQYALLSLCTMYYNLRSSDIRKYITLMLNAPVSLQKHGIRLAFVKYNTDEKIEMVSKLWKNTKNSSIRTVLFTLTFDLLIKEKKVMTIKAIWQVLSSFIDDFNEEENKIMYKTLGKVNEVPLIIVGEFYEKAYLFLKSLPDKVNINHVLESLLDNAENLIEYLENEFVEKSVLIPITNILSNSNGWSCTQMHNILSAYLLCSKDLDIQMQKYNNLLQPVFEICAPKWDKGEKYLFSGIQCFLEHICSKIPNFVFERNMKMPVEILKNIRDAIMRGSLCLKENYIMVRLWQLTVRYIEILDEMKKSNEELDWADTRTASIQHIASICHDFIAKDHITFFPSIYLIFKDSLQTFFNYFDINNVNLLKVLYEMLSWEDCPPMYMLVIDMIPDSGWSDEFESLKSKIKKKIYLYSSEEIVMHYFRRFNDKYSKDA